MSENGLIERLLQACNGHPAAQIPWPHRLLHEAVDTIRTQVTRITELEQQLADAKQAARWESYLASQALADMKALEKDAAWQPIETAPKDHSPRLFRVKGFAVQGFLDVTWKHRVQQNGRPPREMIGKPTHWKPLPKPPIAGEATS